MGLQEIERRMNLNAPSHVVWDALINPEKTKHYMFNCEVVSDWRVGNSIHWRGNYKGYESGDHGIILECRRNAVLRYTSFDPNFGLADKEENYLIVTYYLRTNAAGGTELTTIIQNFNDDPRRLAHIAAGWDGIVLPNLRGVVEAVLVTDQ